MIIEKKISIAFTINNGYVNQLQVVLYSLLKHKKPGTVYDIYLLAYKFSLENVLALEQVLNVHDTQGLCTFTHLALSDEDYMLIPDLNKANVGIRDGWNKDVVLRIFLPKYLPETLAKVLYLDADILIKDDLTDLLTVDLKGKAIAGVLDPIVFNIYGALTMHNYRLAKLEGLSDTEYSHIATKQGYINSGVLLFNLEHWRHHGIGEQLLALMNLINEKGWEYLPLPINPFLPADDALGWSYDFYPDQDVLNYLLLRRNLDEIIYLPVSYNISTSYFSKYTQMLDEECSAVQWLNILHINMMVDSPHLIDNSPKIWHFIGRNKPWLDISHSFAEIYQAHANQVGWQIIYEQEKLNTKPYSYIFKKIIKMILPYGIVRMIQKIRYCH